MGHEFREGQDPPNRMPDARRSAAFVLVMLGFAGFATLQASARQTSPIQSVTEGPVMSADEVKAELFGVEVLGDDDGRPWRECIAPEGKSILHKDGMVYHGTVYVSAAGYQCFIYDEQPGARWCWRMIRNGTDQFINELPNSGARQTMRVVRKKVKECSGEALVG